MADLKALADAANAYDVLCHALIIDELSPVLDQLTEDEAEQAGVLREAIAATQQPLAHIREIETQLQEARDKAEDFRSRIDNVLLTIDDRVQARGYVPFFEQEAEALSSKLDQAETDAEVYHAAVAKARRDLEAVQRAKTGAAEGILDPFNSAFGQACQAFTYHLTAHLCGIILAAGESDPRWDSAIGMLEKLCAASGYRTDDLTKRESEMTKRMFEDFRDAHTPEVTPSAKDLVAANETVLTRVMEDKRHHAVIDDRRNLKLPPRNESVDLAGRPELRWSR